MFNTDGINQLNTDIRKGLLPIIEQFSPSTESSPLARLLETLTLLQMPRAKAVLLKESLQEAMKLNVNEAKEILKEMDVITMQPTMVIQVILRRVDVVQI